MKTLTITKDVYSFAELSERAKENARAWYRDVDDCDLSYVIKDAETVANMLGVQFSQRDVRLTNGNTCCEPQVSYAVADRSEYVAFSGHYRYTKGAVKNIAEYAPQDAELLRIATELQRTQARAFYQLEADCGERRDWLTVNVENALCREVTREQEDTVEQALRDFAAWILSKLNSAYEGQTSDECVDENIEANEYEFDENGCIA